MNFLNLAILGGAAACAIPILIHLFNRSRYKMVQWGAMHLLDSVIRINRKRVRLEQLILLLVRMAIPALIVLFMARPVLTGFQSKPGDVRSSLMVLMDNSYSMQAGPQGQSSFIAAQESARRIVSDLRRGSDVSVVMMAGAVGPIFDKPSFDSDRLLKSLAEQQPGFGIADVGSSSELAAGILAKMNNAKRDMVILSDFQKVSWAGPSAPDIKRLTAMLEGMEIKPSITLMPVGKPFTENISVQSIAFSRSVLGVGQSVQIRATVKNHGASEAKGLRIHLRVDGKDRATSEITLAPGEASQVLFSHSFDQPGSHFVQVATEADSLQADNTLDAAIGVWDKLPVLLISGETSPEPLKSETDFIEIALAPFALAPTDPEIKLVDLIQTTVVAGDKLTAEHLSKTKVAVLANVEKFSESQQSALEDFVRSGGGLLIFPGSRCDISWYNTRMASDGKGLLPMTLASIAGSLTDKDRQTRIQSQHFDHPALELFNLPANGSIADAEVWQWHVLKPPANPEAGQAPAVLARLGTSDPFLVEKIYGAGQVILCSTACDGDWSNLVVRKAFLPLAQQLVTHLASSVYPPRNIDVGKPLLAFFPASKAGATVTLTDPAGKKFELQLQDQSIRAVAEFYQTYMPGLYILSGQGIDTLHYVVNASREESALQTLSEDELTKLAQDLGADLARSPDDYRALDSARRHGREIWRPIFWSALALLFLELFLQQFFARRSA